MALASVGGEDNEMRTGGIVRAMLTICITTQLPDGVALYTFDQRSPIITLHLL